MATSRSFNVLPLLLFVLAVLAVGAIAVAPAMDAVIAPRNAAHANERHSSTQIKMTPNMIRQHRSDGLCNPTEAYFSLQRGTLLILCGIGDAEPKQYAGLVYRVTETGLDGGLTFLADDWYECTAFVSSRRYWNNVIVRDGYVPLFQSAPPGLLEFLRSIGLI